MEEPLFVDVIHLNPLENAVAHHTNKFEVVNERRPKVVIVRRGQPFKGVLKFNRPYDDAIDVVQLLFTYGNQLQMDTRGSMFLRPKHISDNQTWSATITDIGWDSVCFEVKSPVTLPIGCWSLRVITRIRNTYRRQIYDHDQKIFILFNPWHPDDQTYMEDINLLQEYVLNDVGKVWMGPGIETRGTPWVYGQFDAVVLPACMYILNRARMNPRNRGDPVMMARVISRIINSNDDYGVLAGRWSGEYEDGTAPSEWTGSVDILAQYLETQQTVKYGQCWVFAAVVTTVCRALGIPVRNVCNLVSAHDANGSLSVDKYYTETMDILDYNPNTDDEPDSVWNYHVWNDVWMARPELPAGFGGWQAIDATPQERSNGFFQCGPAPLEAIKTGNLGVGFDVGFVLASVNADLMRWRRDPESEHEFSVVETMTYHIGRKILTKKPFVFDPNGDADREDITDQYKFQEGTESERIALMNGVRLSARAKRYYNIARSLPNDVTFKLRDIDSVLIGQEFSIVVNINNTTDEYRKIKAIVIATSLFYNGVKSAILKKVVRNIYVGPENEETITVLVQPDEYLSKLVEYSNIQISAMAFVEETKRAWADDDVIEIIKPNIKIKFNEDLIIGKPTAAVLSVENPLDYPLTECEFRMTSPGIVGRTIELKANNVDAHKMITTVVPVQPNRLGLITFVARFKSAELKDISGAATVEVLEE